MATPEPRTVCLLPGGLVDEAGRVHREAELAQLTGRDEELLTTMEEASTAILVTQILGRSVDRVGDLRPVTEEVARRLLVADRQFLLLKLRQATFGERVEGTLACPWRDCGAKVSIDFSIADIPVLRREQMSATYRLRLSPEAALEGADGERLRWITFRLPNGGDQEAVAPHLGASSARALTLLLQRCVVGIEDAGGDPAALVERLSPRARLEIERQMEARAPAVELDMDLRCPECGRSFTAPFNLQDFFFGELKTSRDLLYRQVHYLAYHYHWSEGEILDLPRDKRRGYIEILADEIEALNDAA